MASVPLFGIGQKGKSPFVTAQSHLNLFAEQTVDGDKTQIAFYGVPGDTLFTLFGDTPIRGWIAIGDKLFVVHRGTLYEVDNAGTRTSRGTLNTTTGKVSMQTDGTVILIVDGTNGYTFTLASNTFAVISDGDFPNGANTCDWLDGQFIVDSGDGEDSFYWSPDGINWDALDFATAESSPDGIVRVLVDHGQLLLFGTSTIEPWGSIGNSDTPFAAVKGAIAQFGLASRWSLVQFNDSVAFLAQNKMGQVQVMMMDGNVPRPISTPEIDSLINGYATVSDATAMAYMDRGHPIYIINFPSAGKSWMFDGKSGMWSPRESGLNGARYHGELSVNYLNKIRIADYSTGSISNLDATVYTENGTAIAREIVTRHLYQGNDRVTVDELYVDMEVGVGTASGAGSDPQVVLQYSKNNGKTWSAELWKTLGAIGNYTTRVIWRRLGQSRDWLFKLRVTDSVPVVFIFTAIKADADK